MRTSNKIKSTVMFAALMSAGTWCTMAIAPQWRTGTGPQWYSGSGGPEQNAILPPMKEVATGKMVRMVVAFRPGTKRRVGLGHDGEAVFQDPTPARFQIARIGTGSESKNDTHAGEQWFDVPKGCEDEAQKMIGHAIEVPKVTWRMPEGDLRVTTQVGSVSREICTIEPDATLDHTFGL